MSYLGNQPAANFTSVTKDTFNGGDTSGASSVSQYTLSKPATTNGVAVYVENVRQIPTTAYSVSGTTLTFTGTTPSGTNNVYVLHHNAVASTATHPAAQALTATSGTFTSTVDINGSELILDADADTSITADTDDQIDIKIGGTDEVTLSSSGIVINEGSNDRDFRIESNDSANMFVVDGGNNLVTLQNDSDTDYNTNQTASNTVLNLKNTTSGASNSVGLSFSTEANGEQYITAVQVSDNSRSDLTFGARNGGSRTETMRIAGSQHLLINMTQALQSAYLSIEGQGRTSCISLDADSSAGGLIDFRFGDSAVGNINTNGSTTSYVTSSDYRLKENINYSFDATTELKKLKPTKFNFKKDKDTTIMGFLAHEVDEVLPYAVNGTKDGTQDLGTIRDKDGNIEQENALEIHTKKDEGQTWTKTKTEDVYQGIDQSKLVPLLVKTIQELEARVTALESA